ncbi:FMN-binding negative transcriptional regulator [Streptomyces decoyicus]|uniref:FMN-binding negative transcriptional regulator n=1 Tax=Streptomyces TaxID=1883 RepID=UPI00345CBFF4
MGRRTSGLATPCCPCCPSEPRRSSTTLVSVRGTGEPVVTQIPLILDRTRGAKGVLFGHLDRATPHSWGTQTAQPAHRFAPRRAGGCTAALPCKVRRHGLPPMPSRTAASLSIRRLR